jgi:hypothetical protein
MRALLAFASLLSLQATPTWAAHADPVKWADIQGWKALGLRWAEALDASGKPIAIYDLSYPSLADRLHVGRLAVPSESMIAQAVSDLRAARPALSAESAESAKTLDQAIAQLTTVHAVPAKLPKSWWKDIPWKRRVPSASDGSPLAFALADIDFDQATHRTKTFQKLLRKAETQQYDGEPIVGAQFLERMFFTREGEGAYDVELRADTLGTAALSRPTKIIDLREIRDGLYNELAWTAAGEALGEAASLISVPVLSALVGTAVSSVFEYQGLLRDQHVAMALEMINVAEDEDEDAPVFAAVARQDLLLGGESLTLADLSLSAIWRWLFHSPEKAWRMGLEGEIERSARAHRWLEDRGSSVESFDTRIAFATDHSGVRRLYSLARPKIIPSLGPHVAIDFSNPDAEARRRVAIETAQVAISFATSFIPWFGGVVSDAYSWCVADPMHGSVEWEARMTVELERYGAFDFELRTLENQRISPFEIPRAKALALAERRRAELGIITPEPTPPAP